MSRDDLHFRLRIPPELKSKVQAAAKQNKRSMTAEIVSRLEESFDEDTYESLNDRIAVFEARIEELQDGFAKFSEEAKRKERKSR